MHDYANNNNDIYEEHVVIWACGGIEKTIICDTKKSRHDVPALECICCVGLIDVENRAYFQNRKFVPCQINANNFIA